MITPVLLCGGSGTRLWPMSRAQAPKQFLPLLEDDASSIQHTAMRMTGLPSIGPAIVVCHEDYRFLVAEQLRQIPLEWDTILLEPEGRNTAPAITVAALQALRNDPEAVLLVLPTDHLVRDREAFQKVVQEAVIHAERGHLVTFGAAPDRPETGYGYLRRGRELDPEGAWELDHFIEKPDLRTAKTLMKSQEYFWNSGVFMFRAAAFLQEMRTFQPEILSQCREALDEVRNDLDFARLGKEAFRECPSLSVDVAVMENTRQGVVIPLSAGWRDLGDWGSFWEVGARDEDGNVTRGDVVLEDVENSLVQGTSRLVAAVGVDDIVVVETEDAVLVADRGKVQDVRALVARLKGMNRPEASKHRRVLRPWGSFESVIRGERFQVKKIVVNPGAALSLQMHHHRAEHWVVVRGVARVTADDREFTLSEDQSTYLPLGTVHRLENPGLIPLEMIEVQTGSYLGEDDIVRIDDVYGRVEEPTPRPPLQEALVLAGPRANGGPE